MPRAYRRETYLLISEFVPRIQGLFAGRLLQEQRGWQVPSPSPASPCKHMVTCGNQQHQHPLYNLLTPSPTTPTPTRGSTLSSHTCLIPSSLGPFLWKTDANLANIVSPHLHFLWDLRSSGIGGGLTEAQGTAQGGPTEVVCPTQAARVQGAAGLVVQADQWAP